MRIFAVFLLIATVCSGAEAAIIGITSNGLRTEVRDDGTTVDSDNFTGTGIPSSLLVQSNGGSADQFAKVNIAYTDSGSQVVLNHQFDFSRQGGQGDLAQLYNDSLYFTASQNTTFSASGMISVNDIGATSGNVSMWVYLYDLTAPGYKFYSLSDSKNTVDESLVLGVAGGDNSNSIFGSLNGTLVAGHSYRWFFSIYTYAQPDADSGATATGFLKLTIGESENVATPEPASLVIWAGLGVAGLVAARRRKRLPT
jgi:hypothetical protein